MGCADPRSDAAWGRWPGDLPACPRDDALHAHHHHQRALERDHRIVGLELGADDYLAKPFSVLELVARVKALLRRVDALAKSGHGQPGASVRLGRLFIDPIARTAALAGTPLELTPREFDLLHFFARHPDQVFSRLELLNGVWGYTHEGYEHTVNTHINRLRAKIETDPAQPACIVTVWGHGYKLLPPGEAS